MAAKILNLARVAGTDRGRRIYCGNQLPCSARARLFQSHYSTRGYSIPTSVSNEAEEIIAKIEKDFGRHGCVFNDEKLPHIRLTARRFTPLREVAKTLFMTYRQRTAVGLALMAAQAFFYNAIFFTLCKCSPTSTQFVSITSVGTSYRFGG